MDHTWSLPPTLWQDNCVAMAMQSAAITLVLRHIGTRGRSKAAHSSACSRRDGVRARRGALWVILIKGRRVVNILFCWPHCRLHLYKHMLCGEFKLTELYFQRYVWYGIMQNIQFKLSSCDGFSVADFLSIMAQQSHPKSYSSSGAFKVII